ncbi:polysaccharide deacetylase family protein [Salinicoccus cyprini]|uniref:Polysaccharide deacetylase family protein n=1 Tax=Salinicoccus cyprini TaxID=2493691 RepID=A0A558B002_9STAP|nr:polysaccharide deacetylase family protein [Salinicoccus cyprini]TVT29831.1 polysaccharide deacetylase family protein [Salinicoccus cyprini]
MKKRVFLLMCCGSILFAGCQNDSPEDESNADASSHQAANEEQPESTEESSVEEVTEEAETVELPKPVEQAAYEYSVNENTYAIQPIEGSSAESQVALLTYDDAPDGHAVRIAEILAQHDAPAIFFVNGMYLESEAGRDALNTIHEMGFEIGNHTQTHASLPDLSPEAQRAEIVETNDLVEEITGERPRFFRAPFGQNTETSSRIASEQGMVLMNWTYGYDWEAAYQEADALADIMVNSEYLNAGSNLLMHDRAWTRDASADIVEGLRGKGYTIVDPDKISSPEREAAAE